MSHDQYSVVWLRTFANSYISTPSTPNRPSITSCKHRRKRAKYKLQYFRIGSARACIACMRSYEISYIVAQLINVSLKRAQTNRQSLLLLYTDGISISNGCSDARVEMRCECGMTRKSMVKEFLVVPYDFTSINQNIAYPLSDTNIEISVSQHSPAEMPS